MKTIIAGSRSLAEMDFVETAMELAYRSKGILPTVVFSGGARGVDVLGERWANERKIPIVRFIPKWGVHGRRAGIIRNVEMCEQADALVAVWDERSPGTRHVISEAKRRNLEVHVHRIRTEFEH